MPLMAAVLLTGMSGTGKSSVVDALVDRGIAAVDLDRGYVIVHQDGTQEWDEVAVAALLEACPGELLVLAGCEDNMVRFLDRFDAIVLLSAPLTVMRERILSRSSHDFGKSPGEWERVVADTRAVEPRLRAVATHEVPTDRPLPEVVADVVAIIETL